MISNQILRKYSRDRKARKVTKVKMSIPARATPVGEVGSPFRKMGRRPQTDFPFATGAASASFIIV